MNSYQTLTIFQGGECVVLANAVEDANDSGQRIVYGRVTGGNGTYERYHGSIAIKIGSLPIRKIADGLYTVVDLYA